MQFRAGISPCPVPLSILIRQHNRHHGLSLISRSGDQLQRDIGLPAVMQDQAVEQFGAALFLLTDGPDAPSSSG